MYEIDHRLKSGRPNTDGVDGEMQEKERAEDESCDGEVLARAGTAAAPAVALCFGVEKSTDNKSRGRKGLGCARNGNCRRIGNHRAVGAF
jgi:hypothetical protein